MHKEGIRTALLRQTILTCLQEDFTSFFRDADFPMLMERDILLWAGFSQVPLPAVGRGLMDIFQGLRRRAAQLYSCGCAHRTGGRRLLCPAAGRREKRAGKRE